MPHSWPSVDFFVVPTITFRLLFVLIVLAHPRRRVIQFNVTTHPSSEWTARQIAEAFPRDIAPRYLLHDRDSIYAGCLHDQVREMGIREVLTAPRSPWQFSIRGASHWLDPEGRTVQSLEMGPVIELAELGGLHHRYERRAA
jgi:hypothetical protein